jgi:magnesium transporter
MPRSLLVPELLEMLAEGRHAELAEFVAEQHPKDAADFLSGLDDDHVIEVLAILPVPLASSCFVYFDADRQERIVVGSGRERVRALLSAMSSDDRAAFFESLDERVRDSILPLLARAAKEDLLRRDLFEPDQVGSILSTDYCALRSHLTVPQAIEQVRAQAPSKDTVYYSYVVDDDGRLLGIVSLRDLILARAHQTVGQIMKTDAISVFADDDQEHAADRIREYALIAIPVVDRAGKLLGIVTHDDAAEVAEEEAAEDMERLAGITRDDELAGYAGESVLSHFRRRVLWVSCLAGSFFATAAVIKAHDRDLSQLGVLAALLPLVLATGGNVGAQAATAVLLGLKQELTPRSLPLVLWKELRVAMVLAIVLATIAGFVAWLVLGGEPAATGDGGHVTALQFSIAVGAAMALHVITAALVGAAIPLAVAALRHDPAMVAIPALTTIADLSGTVIYFVTATWLLDLGV